MTVMLDMPRRAAPAASAAPATPCAADPDRWLNSGNDPQVKALCRLRCPRRFACAAEALNIPYPQGIWSGVYLDSNVQARSRATGLRQLASIAMVGNQYAAPTRVG